MGPVALAPITSDPMRGHERNALIPSNIQRKNKPPERTVAALVSQITAMSTNLFKCSLVSLSRLLQIEGMRSPF